MPYPIEQKTVIAVASSALFDLSESEKVFNEQGPDAYRRYQHDHENAVLAPGVAFPFIKRFLDLNRKMPDQSPVDVVLISKNDADTGMRVFNSIEHYGLDIVRAAFTKGNPPYEYIPTFNAKLFLSHNADDVTMAVELGYPAGLVQDTEFMNDDKDYELRLAFDFDGIIADDESEKVYKAKGINAFHDYEAAHATVPLRAGPLEPLFRDLAKLQQIERQYALQDPSYRQMLRIVIATARSAPAHKRVITTLRSLGLQPDEVLFLGGINKARALQVFKPHIFFDDQSVHTNSVREFVPAVLVPFGAANAKG